MSNILNVPSPSGGNGVQSPVPIPEDMSADQGMTLTAERGIRRNNVDEVLFVRHRKRKTIYQIDDVTDHDFADPQISNLLDEAFTMIVDANDTYFDEVQRSNCFDDWRKLVHRLSRITKLFSVKQNAVLGAILVATNKKDLWDFSPNTVEIFREATSLLRKPGLTQLDVNRILDALLSNGLTLTWPTDNMDYPSSNTESLEEIIERLENIK